MIFIVFFSLYLIYSPKSALAQGYVVKPVILIPSDWKNVYSDSYIETQYKVDILRALSDVKEFYSSKLDGATFTFENNVEIAYSDGNTSKISISPTTSFLHALGGLKNTNLRLDPEAIYAVWILGSNDITPSAGPPAKFIQELEGRVEDISSAPPEVAATAVMNHVGLETLSSKTEMNSRNVELGVISHELGHAFGLIFGKGWARGHSCSVAQKDSCKKLAPEPLPPPEESLEGIMNTGLAKFPNSRINNSAHNPEQFILCKSPYFSGEKSNCVEPDQINQEQQKELIITNVLNDSAVAGEALWISIFGEGFGRETGKVELILDSDPNIISDGIAVMGWHNEVITFQVKENAGRGNKSIWKVKVTKPNGKYTISDNLFTIEKKIKVDPITFSAEVKLYCGEFGYQKNTLVNVYKMQQGEKKLLQQVISDNSGTALISYTDPSLNEIYLIPQEYDVSPSPDEIVLTPGEHQETSVHYLYCHVENNDDVNVPVVQQSRCIENDLVFAGCNVNACGEEFWRCPKDGRTLRLDNLSGDCALKGGPNPACENQGRAGYKSNTEEAFDAEGNRVPFFGLLLGPDQDDSLQKLQDEGQRRIAEMKDYSGSLDYLKSQTSDPEVMRLIDQAQGKVNACYE